MRGGSFNNHYDNARCAYRNRNHPDNRNNNIGFRVVLRSPHVLPGLFLVPQSCGTARRYNRVDCVPVMRADSVTCTWVGPPRRRKKNSARQVWSARTPQSRGRWGITQAGRIVKLGHGQAFGSPLPAPPFSVRYCTLADSVCLIQPPRSLPT